MSAQYYCVIALRRVSVTAPFCLEDSRRERESERGRESERERERERAHARGRESMRKRFGSSFCVFFPPPGPALCRLGLARSAVCSVCSAWGLHSGPRTVLVFGPPPFWTAFPCSTYLTLSIVPCDIQWVLVVCFI